SSGVSKYAVRSIGLPLPDKLSNSPRSMASLMIASTSLSKDIKRFYTIFLMIQFIDISRRHSCNHRDYAPVIVTSWDFLLVQPRALSFGKLFCRVWVFGKCRGGRVHPGSKRS